MKLEHVAINVPAPADMAAWWSEHIGMRIVVAKNDAPPHMHFVADSAEASMVELYHNTTAPVPDYTALSPYTLHFAFTSGDIVADRARLIAAGATAIDEIAENATGDKLTFLRDPWGVTIQLLERVKPLI